MVTGDRVLELVRSGIPGKAIISKELDGVEYFIRLEDRDKYSILFSEVGLINDSHQGVDDADNLEKVVHELEVRLSFLTEEMKLVELEQNSLTALLRSHKPEKDGDLLRYYELLLSKGKKINFYRIENNKGEKSKINMVLPDNLFVQLMTLLTGVIKEE